ncbi:hypothetical protein An05g02430 [Aspergillus niger]|uniref:Uncharacterized protein n=2 Tax=Aspergillus niger TaxID=5061 RepID=A2QL38_ASPNC|nr:hypothetical protein An05g02430 [Aspergillus niger]CAK44904.1 hypothetical protein An05g02430 [Aspergillus niger]
MLKVLINEDNLGVSRGANYSDLVHNRVKESDCCDLASVVTVHPTVCVVWTMPRPDYQVECHCGQSIDDRKNVEAGCFYPRRQIPSGNHMPCPCTDCDAMDPLFMSHAPTEQDPVNLASGGINSSACRYEAVFKKIN